MALHPDTIRAIPNNWDATKYDGPQDVRPWLMEIEEKCRIDRIPEAQMTEIAIECTDGEVNIVLTAMFEAKVAEAGEWPWADFKECVIQIEGEHNKLYCWPQPWTPPTICDRRLQAKHKGSVPEIR